MALVLCTGVDQSLIRTRKLILERAGHTVVTASNQHELMAACREHQFDVAVIGQTVSLNIKKSVASLIRQYCPDAKLLELYQVDVGRAVEDADSWMEVPTDVPKDLSDRVTDLANGGPARP